MDVLVDIILWFLDCFDASTQRASELMSYDLNGDKLKAATAMAETLNADVIIPIATQILTICFLIRFLKIVNIEEFTRIETFIKIFFLLSFSKSALNYSFKICKTIYSEGAKLIVKANKTFLKQESTGLRKLYEKSLEEALSDLSILQWIAFLFCGLIFIIIIIVTIVLISFIAWGRYIELMLLMCGAALPMAFIPLEKEGGQIVKNYFTHFAAVCLQGFVIIASFAIARSLANSIVFIQAETDIGLAKALGVIGSAALIGLLLLMSLFKSHQIAQKYLGQC